MPGMGIKHVSCLIDIRMTSFQWLIRTQIMHNLCTSPNEVLPLVPFTCIDICDDAPSYDIHPLEESIRMMYPFGYVFDSKHAARSFIDDIWT